jgi:hypothetical protein
VALFFGLAVASYTALRQEPQRGMTRLRLSQLDADGIDTVTLSGANGVTLSRAKDGANAWLLPNGHKAEGAMVAHLLGELQKLNTSDVVTQDTGRFIDLNVEGPKATEIRLAKNGKVLALLHVGEGNSPDGFYVRQGDTVFRAKGPLAHAVRRAEKDWQDRRLYDDAAEELAAVTVAAKGQPELRLVAEGGVWALANPEDLPKNMRFDSAQAAALVRSLTDLRADRFIDDHPGEAVTQFGDAIGWTFTPEGQTRTGVASRRLLVGAASQEGERYVQVENAPQLYSVSANSLSALFKKVDDLRAMTIMAPGKFDDLTAVSITPMGAKTPVSFRKQADGTFAPASGAKLPKGFVLDNLKLRQRANQALLARAIRYIGPQKPSHRIGAANTGSIGLTDKDGKRTSLTFGRALTGDEGVGFYAKGSADSDVYVISKALHDSLTADLHGLAKKTPVAAPGAAAAGINGLTPEMEAQIRRQLAQSQQG